MRLFTVPKQEIEIDVDALGHGRVMINGANLAPVLNGVDLTFKAGELARVTLHLIPDHVRVAPVPADVTVVLAAIQNGDVTALGDAARRRAPDA
jgi:hypothetical protein